MYVRLNELRVTAEPFGAFTVDKIGAGALAPFVGQTLALQVIDAESHMGVQVDEAPPDNATPVISAEVLALALKIVGTKEESYVPERLDTLRLQQAALVSGIRAVQMFPTGTPELPLPMGAERIVTPRGAFHFNPRLIEPDAITAQSENGSENNLLGYGPHSKADVLSTLAPGELPYCVIELAPGEIEVRSAIANKSTAKATVKAMQDTADPANKVTKWNIDDVIAHRLAQKAEIVVTGGSGRGYAKPVNINPGEIIEIKVGAGGSGKTKSGAPRKKPGPKPKAKASEQSRPARTAKSAAPAKKVGSPFN